MYRENGFIFILRSIEAGKRGSQAASELRRLFSLFSSGVKHGINIAFVLVIEHHEFLVIAGRPKTRRSLENLRPHEVVVIFHLGELLRPVGRKIRMNYRSLAGYFAVSPQDLPDLLPLFAIQHEHFSALRDCEVIP